MRRMERAVRNCPGIYKEFLVSDDGKEVPSGRYRSVRKNSSPGTSRKEQAFFSSFQDAKDFRDFKIDKIVGGLHRERSPEGMKFCELVERWKQTHFFAVDVSTRETYEKLLPALHWLDEYVVKSIDAEVLLAFGHHLREEFPRTSRRKSFEKEIQVLRVILNFFRENVKEGAAYGLPPFKTLRRITRVRPKSDTSVKYLSPPETVTFLQELKNERDPQYHLVALVQYYIAGRIGEALGLMPKAISLERMEIRVERAVNWHIRSWVPYIKEHPKNKKTRVVPVPPELAGVLTELMRGKKTDELLFQQSDGSPLNRKTVSTVFNRVLRRLGFTHVSGTHFIRKTTATHAKLLTGDIDAVSRYLGHSSSRVTRLYVGELDEQKQVIAKGLGGLLEGLKEEKEAAVPHRPAIRLVK